MRDKLNDLRPALMRFAVKLTRSTTAAEDLVQDTMLRALTYETKFEPGTNLNGWLYTIMRNTYFMQQRRAWRLVPGAEKLALYVPVEGRQEGVLDLADCEQQMAQMNPVASELLYLDAVEGLSYEEMAQQTGVPIGTVKSRLSRARKEIATRMRGHRNAA